MDADIDARRQAQDGSTLLWDANRVAQAAPHHFDRQWWAERGELWGTAQGRGAAAFVGPQDAQWVLRHYRRGGLVQRLSQDRYLWFGAERSRPLCEWNLLADLLRLGLPVPAPVAARVTRRGWCYDADLITLRIPATETLAQRLAVQVLPAGSWQALGQVLARFHAAGVYHHDLNAHNVLLAASTRFWLIDFDRGRLRKPGGWAKRNLARLRRSLDKLAGEQLGFCFAEADWAALEGGYLSMR